MTPSRLERLLPVACLVAAIVLFVSQLMTIFEFTPPGAEPLDSRTAIADHGPAMLIVATAALLALVAAVWVGSRPAAIAVAVFGVLALLFFLIADLPDAGQVGTLDDPRQSFIDAEVLPQAGFWLEMLAALGLALSGGALATMTTEQLVGLRGNIGRRGTPKRKPPAGKVPSDDKKAA